MSRLGIIIGFFPVALLTGCASNQDNTLASSSSTARSTAAYASKPADSGQATRKYSAEELLKYDAVFTFPDDRRPYAKRISRKSTASYSAPSKRLKPRSSRKKPYFIEFRARNALTYGHTFVVFGVLDKNGNVPTDKNGVLVPGLVEIAGLHPDSDEPAQFTLGHVVPVPALTGPSDGDTEAAYVLAKYRIDLTPEEFDYVVKKVRERKAKSKAWFAPVYACVQFTNALAKDLGMKTPAKLLLPKGFTNYLKAKNGTSLPPMRKS